MPRARAAAVRPDPPRRISPRSRRKADRRRWIPSGSPRLASASCSAIRASAARSACTTVPPAGSPGLTRGTARPGARGDDPGAGLTARRHAPNSLVICGDIFRTAEFPSRGSFPLVSFRRIVPARSSDASARFPRLLARPPYLSRRFGSSCLSAEFGGKLDTTIPVWRPHRQSRSPA